MIYHLYSSYVLNFNKVIKINNLDLRVMRRKRIEVWKDTLKQYLSVNTVI